MWQKLLLVSCLLALSALKRSNQSSPLETVFEWTHVEYDYETLDRRNSEIKNHQFKIGEFAIIDMDVQYRSRNNGFRVFVTMPKFMDGIPVSLGIVGKNRFQGNPKIVPYPNWTWHKNLRSCRPNMIISVFRILIDECNRLWFVDTGKIGEEQVCPPRILAFDLYTDRVVHQYQIPSDNFEARSTFVNLAVDIRNSQCQRTFVYIADCETYSIVVHDAEKNRSWRIRDKTFYPYPSFGTYELLGDKFDLMDGILALALGPYSRSSGDRKLYYHAMSSGTENWVYTSDIRNSTRFKQDPQSSPDIFHTLSGNRGTQSGPIAIDENGIMYFGTISDTALNCWNTDNEDYGPDESDVLVQDSQNLQFITGMKIKTDYNDVERLWVLSSRYQRIAAGTVNPSETNFRILVGTVKDLMENAKCITQTGSGLPLLHTLLHQFESDEKL